MNININNSVTSKAAPSAVSSKDFILRSARISKKEIYREKRQEIKKRNREKERKRNRAERDSEKVK